MLSLIITIVVLGVALYLLETYVPLPPPIRILLRVLVVLAIVIYLFRFAGIVP